MSNELKQLVKQIQFKTDLTIELIAKGIGYSRAYFNDQINKGDNNQLAEILRAKYMLDNEQSVPRGTSVKQYNFTHPEILKVQLESKQEILAEKELRIQEVEKRIAEIEARRRDAEALAAKMEAHYNDMKAIVENNLNIIVANLGQNREHLLDLKLLTDIVVKQLAARPATHEIIIPARKEKAKKV